MAKVNLRSDQWGTIFVSVENRGKTLQEEANRLKITVEDLIACGDEKFAHNPKRWEACKRTSEKRAKKRTPKKRKPTVPQNLISAPVPAPTPDAVLTPNPANSMEEFLRKKEELQNKVASCAAPLEEAQAILRIRQETLTEAKSVLEKAQKAFNQAQTAVQKAQSDVNEAQQAVLQAQARQEEAQLALQRVEEEILRNQVYLVAPWFSGTLPEYGTFISTVEMEGVKVLEPAELIKPDIQDMVFAGFDFLSEYMKALAFVSLVQDYILAGKEIHVINTDQRVQKLLKKYIGA